MVPGLVGGRASAHLRSSDTLDHSLMNLPSIWFPNNPPEFFFFFFTKNWQTVNF